MIPGGTDYTLGFGNKSGAEEGLGRVLEDVLMSTEEKLLNPLAGTMEGF